MHHRILYRIVFHVFRTLADACMYVIDIQTGFIVRLLLVWQAGGDGGSEDTVELLWNSIAATAT